MNINFYKNTSVLIIAIFCILFSLNTKISHADTTTQSTYDYSLLDPATQYFVIRLNQLPKDFVFNNNLRKDQSLSPDIKYLKWVLNSDLRTALADDPTMTLDQLSSSFGPITEAAVKKFQTIYKADILTPQGLTEPTGVVGNSTRQKLNWMLQEARKIVFTGNYDSNTGSTSTTTNSTSTTNTTSSNSSSNGGSSKSGGILGNDGSPSITASSSPAKGIPSPLAVLGVTALATGDFIGASAAAYLNGNGTGTAGIINLATTGATGGAISSPSSKSSSGNGAAAGGIIAGGVVAGSLMGGSGSSAGSAAAGGASRVVIGQFGGRIVFNMLCACSSNYLITVLNEPLKIPLSVMYQPPISSLKQSYNPTIGETVLGGYTTGGVCMIYVGTGCSPYGIPIGTIDTMRGIGTTMTPATK